MNEILTTSYIEGTGKHSCPHESQVTLRNNNGGPAQLTGETSAPGARENPHFRQSSATPAQRPLTLSQHYIKGQPIHSDLRHQVTTTLATAMVPVLRTIIITVINVIIIFTGLILISQKMGLVIMKPSVKPN